MIIVDTAAEAFDDNNDDMMGITIAIMCHKCGNDDDDDDVVRV